MPSKSLIFKLFLIAVIICCLTTSTASGAKITKPKTKSVAKPSEEVTTAKSTITHDVTKADNDNNDDDEEDNDDTSSEESDDTAEKNAVQPGSESSLSVWGIVRGVWNWIRDDISAGFFGGDDDDTTSSVSEGRAGQSVEGRTFGKIRRLQMALIPIIFKFGVLTAMVAFLVAIGMKTLFLVKVLLAMNALALLGKFFTLKSNFGHMPYPAHSSWNPHAHIEYVAPQPSWGWGPPPTSSGWSAAPVAAAPEYKHLEHEHHAASSNSAQPTKEIHLHIHGGQAAPKVEAYSYSTPSNGWQRSDPYVAYDPSSTLSAQSDLTVDATKSIPFQVDTNVPSNHRMF